MTDSIFKLKCWYEPDEFADHLHLATGIVNFTILRFDVVRITPNRVIYETHKKRKHVRLLDLDKIQAGDTYGEKVVYLRNPEHAYIVQRFKDLQQALLDMVTVKVEFLRRIQDKIVAVTVEHDITWEF